MAPKMLVEYFEPHREWIEARLAECESDQAHEDALTDLWIALPEPPKEFFYNG